MQLNAIGLVGVLVLINLIQFVGFDFVTGTCLVLLSDNETCRSALAPPLVRKNPLVTFNDKQFKKDFRFAKADIPKLLRVLQWPPVMYTVNRVVFSSEICLLMVLYRFAFPSTMNKFEVTFGVHHTACSHIVTRGVELLSAKFENRLTDFDLVLVLQRLEMYKAAIHKKSKGVCQDCYALIDATLHQITRPCGAGRRRRNIRNQNNIQRAAYSGHKRHHGLKFQSVIVPDGMLVQMFGPIEGRRHDTTVLKESRLEERLQLLPPDCYIYGDQAYPVRTWLLSPFRGPNKPIPMRRWNRKMRTVRISVEHGYKIITTLWSHLRYVPAQQVFKTPVAKQYVACAALTNLHNCLYPNQVAQHFGLTPPSLEEYCAMYV